MAGGYIRSFDGARALSVIMVMAFHAGLLDFAWASVQLFFVLSGFLITSILWKEKSRSDSFRNKLKNFIIRRSLRIFPLYFAYLLLFGLLFLTIGFPSYYPVFAPYLFSYTVNYTRLIEGWQVNPLFTHLWSLSIEEQFYLFYPFVILLLPARRVRMLLIVVILLSPLFRFLLGLHYWQLAAPTVAADAVYWNTLTHLDAFFLGGLIPVLSLENRVKKPHRLFAVFLVLTWAAGLLQYLNAAGAAPYLRDLGYGFESVAHYAHVWRYGLLNLLFASFILCLVSPGVRHFSATRWFLERNWLVRIGRVSYGMYLFHWAVLVYVFERYLPSANLWMKLAWFMPYVATVYLIAELSFRLFESRFLLLKDRWSPVRRTSVPQVPADADISS